MYKICYIIGQLSRHGAEKQLYELVKGINREIFKPIVISLSEGGFWAEEIRKMDIEVIELRRRKNKEPARLFNLVKILKSISPALVHTYMFSANSYGRVAAIINRIPIIISSERNLPEIGKDKNIYQIIIDKVLSFISDAIICNSYQARKSLVEKYLYDKNKVITIHNGITPTNYLNNSDMCERNKSKRKIIGTIGRLSHQKNQKLFLDIAKKVIEISRNKEMQFILIGEGPLEDDLKKYCAKLGLEKHVVFMGERTDLPKLLAGIDILVMTSLYEGLSNAIMEAMIAEVPVIATDVGGTSEVVIDGETGYLCQVDDTLKLTDRVISLIYDESKAKRMGENGKKRMLDKFGIEKMVKKTENTYLELIRRKNIFYQKNEVLTSAEKRKITAGGDTGKIAYITAQSPLVSIETFILTEMLALKKYGVKLLLLPREKSTKEFHKEAIPLKDNIINVSKFNIKVIRALISYIYRNPTLVIQLLFDIVIAARNLKISIKNLVIFPKALYLSDIMDKDTINHIHAHRGSTPSTMAYIISRVTGIPWSMTLHRFDIYENNLLKNKVEAASFIRCISNKGRRDLLQIIGDECADKIHVIHMGVEIPFTNRNGNGNKFNKDHTWHIVIPANILPVKGHAYVIEAINYLKTKGINNIQCSFYGDGPLKRELETKIKKYGLIKYINIEGLISHDQLLQRYSEEKIDILILPSIITGNGEFEGIPVSLMEAMAYEIPVISTNTGGIPELIGDGSGIMIEEKDPLAIAGSINKLMNDEHYYKLISCLGREKIEKEFNVNVTSRDLLNLFSQNSIN